TVDYKANMSHHARLENCFGLVRNCPFWMRSNAAAICDLQAYGPLLHSADQVSVRTGLDQAPDLSPRIVPVPGFFEIASKIRRDFSKPSSRSHSRCLRWFVPTSDRITTQLGRGDQTHVQH